MCKIIREPVPFWLPVGLLELPSRRVHAVDDDLCTLVGDRLRRMLDPIHRDLDRARQVRVPEVRFL